MPPTIIETLKRISYDNLEQFVADLNSNFGIIQNSPLYKGVPGKKGISTQGLRGIRGNQFLFVNYANFNTQFPNELINGSQINLLYINSKLSQFENKQKLLLSLGIIEFVDNDIIVLTNSIMLSYNDTTNTFTDTLLAFNQQANLISSIETKIEHYVQLYVSENQTIQNLVNIFEGYDTYAKNVPDSDNTELSNIQTASSIFAPYFFGVDNTNGVKQTNHKYYGFADAMFPETNNGTFVFGSMKKYTEMLMETISLTSVQPLSSDYAPGINNIPSAIFLQDSENNGIMFGLKSKLNLSTFGSIYKDANGNIVIKSDSGIIDSEFSKLLISRTRLAYSKPVFFGNNLEVGNDLSIIGNINNTFFRSGNYIEGNTNPKLIEVGYKSGFESDGIWRNISDLIQYTNYVEKVLVTDSYGNISKDYFLETTLFTEEDLHSLAQITTGFGSNKLIVTSELIGNVIIKLNNICEALTTGSLSNLTISDTLTTAHIKFSSGFASRFLSTDGNGNVLGTYRLESVSFVDNDLLNLAQITTVLDSSTSSHLINSPYLGKIITKLNNVCTYIENNYYTKNDFQTGIEDNIIFRGKITLETSNVQTYWSNKILITDFYGTIGALDMAPSTNINDDYFVDVPQDTTTALVENTTGPILLTGLHLKDVNPKSLVNGGQWGWLIKILNNIKTRLGNTFNKTESVNAIYSQLPTGSIILWSMLDENGELATSNSPSIPYPAGWVPCDGSTNIPIGYTSVITNQATTPAFSSYFSAIPLMPLVKIRETADFLQYEAPSEITPG